MEQLAALFNSEDLIAYKSGLSSLPIYALDNQKASSLQFFCLNPLKTQGKLEVDNIACYRNILIEMDKGSIEEQWKLIERSEIPWTTCVYSGGKSLHFIISIKEGIDSLSYYTRLAKVICKALDADTSVVNPNRLTRLAGGVRQDNNVLQELIEVRKQITLPELLAWRFLHAPKKLRKSMDKIEDELTKLEFARLNAEAAPDEPKTILPNIYRDMVETGALHPDTTSRHQSLVKFGVWLKENWHKPEEIEELLIAAQTALGIDGRTKDLQNLVKWLKI